MEVDLDLCLAVLLFPFQKFKWGNLVQYHVHGTKQFSPLVSSR